MPIFPISLLKRLVVGSPLTPAQEDGNMTTIENAANDLNTRLSVSLNPNGTLKAGSINNSNIFGPRVVNLNALAFGTEFWEPDTGGADALVISNTGGGGAALGAYAAGVVFYVKAKANNTGASTLAVDALAPRAIKKVTGGGLVDLVAGDIIANGEYEFVDDGTRFVLLNPTLPAVPPGSVVQHTATDLGNVLTHYSGINSFADFPVAHGAGSARPLFVQWSLLCIATPNIGGGIAQYDPVSNDEIAVDNLLGTAVGAYDVACTSMVDDNFLVIAWNAFNAGAGYALNARGKDGVGENSLITNAWRLRVRWGVLT